MEMKKANFFQERIHSGGSFTNCQEHSLNIPFPSTNPNPLSYTTSSSTEEEVIHSLYCNLSAVKNEQIVYHNDFTKKQNKNQQPQNKTQPNRQYAIHKCKN